MSDRRYEVYGVRKCDCGCAALPNQHAGSYALLDSAPDALVEEAAKRMAATDAPWEPPFYGMDVLARAALSVLFPGEEEE